MIGLHDAVHFGDRSETGTLRIAGAKHLMILDENYSVGPSASDATWHRELRRAFWAVRGLHVEPLDFNETLRHVPRHLEAADWVTDSWMGILRRWWLITEWRRAKVMRPLWLVPPGVYNPSQVADALAHAKVADTAQREQSEALWRAFLAEDPRELDRMRRLLDLSIARSHGAHFPIAVGARIEPSPLDALLLGTFTVREWRPSRLLLDPKRGDRLTEEWILQFGDSDVLDRVLEWTRWPRRAPALEMRTLRSGSDWTRCEFRLTRAGRKLLDEGTRDPAELAPRAVGGAEATRWLRRELADGDYELIAR